jgi:hypothetical protein
MKNGDYISVRVMNTTPTLGVRLLRALQLHPGDLSIYSSYGGAVGNNIQ